MQLLTKQHGFNFLELLIVLVLLTGTILPIIHFQSINLREGHSDIQLSLAADQAENLVERLRVNPNETSRIHELNLWQSQLPFYLPQGVGDYLCANVHSCVVHLQWLDGEEKNFTINFIL